MTETARKLTASIGGDFLVIRLPLNSKPMPSATGKTLVVASSHGNKETGIEVQGKSPCFSRDVCELDGTQLPPGFVQVRNPFLTDESPDAPILQVFVRRRLFALI
jgi:hypothetical protein